jgi:trehalose 2-sulfotransferase
VLNLSRALTEEKVKHGARELPRLPVTANGVWAAKMMWNYAADAISRLRAWPRLGVDADAADCDVLAAAFPGLRYVWLRREDKLRQAISWWRADATGQYALAAGQAPSAPPTFDRDAIDRLVQFAEACETGWRDWFDAHSITPLEIVYEDLVTNLDRAVSDIAGFLDVTMPPGLDRIRPRLQRQADHHTEALIELFRHHDGK